MIDSQFLCSTCNAVTDAAYEDFVSDVTAAAAERLELSTVLWGLTYCPYGHELRTELSYPLDSWGTLLEQVTLEAAEFMMVGNASTVAEIKPVERKTSLNHLKRSSAYLDALNWIALAVTAGVLGNVAHDLIRALIRKMLSPSNTLSGEDGNLGELRAEFLEIDDNDIVRYESLAIIYVERRLDGVRIIRISRHCGDDK